jgi:hypothetical protein
MRAWRYHLLYTLPRGLTLPIFISGMVGLACVFVYDWRRALVLYSYPLAFFALIGWSWVFVARYTTATLPFLAIAAGWMLVQTADLTRLLGLSERARGWVTVLLLVVASSYSMFEVANLLRLFRGVDSRRTVATWTKENIPDGARIGWLGTVYGRPALPESPESIEGRLALPMQPGNTGRLLRKKIELARRHQSPQYLVVDLPREPSEWREELPEYLFVEKYRLFWTQSQTSLADEWLDKGGFKEVRHWVVTDPGEALPYADPQDAVYLPFGNTSRVRCSGPELVLYKR